MKRKLILIYCFFLMLILSCSKKENTTVSKELATFSKYDLSFQYPADFPITEFGLLSNEANETSGLVQAGRQEKDIIMYQVTWIKTEKYDLEKGLEGGFAGLKNSKGIEKVARGKREERELKGHRVLLEDYSVQASTGEKVYGILAGLYCDKAGRGYVLMTMNSTISKREDVISDFEKFLNSFNCH
ncbi:MAG: hypothetical protein JW827_11060 [Spirochaetes bacterium]|nr:hypothetical protein [Spirochaetota bacterium]